MNIKMPSNAAETETLVNALVMGADEFRKLKGLSEKMFYRRLESGLLPERIEVGGRQFFSRVEGEAWSDVIATRPRLVKPTP